MEVSYTLYDDLQVLSEGVTLTGHHKIAYMRGKCLSSKNNKLVELMECKENPIYLILHLYDPYTN